MADAHRDHRALGAIRIAEMRMLEQYPFHARILASWVRSASNETETMAVTVRGGRVYLLFSSSTVLVWSLDELAAVLAHEVNHVVFGHLWMDPVDYPDERALLVAQETTVNEWIADALPGSPILLSQYPELSEDESTRDRYQILADPQGRPDPGRGGNAPEGRQGAGEQADEAPSDDEPGRAGGEGDGEPAEAQSDRDTPSASELRDGTPARPGPVDDHRFWSEARSDETARSALAASAITARAAMTVDEWARLPDAVREAVEVTMRFALGHGAEPSGIKTELGDGHPTVDWRRELRRLAGRAGAPAASLSWPSRRLPHLVGVVPGVRRQPERPRLLAVIDTSGSIDDETLAAISAELNVMRRVVDVVVAECDAKIHRVYQLDGPVRDVAGRGGTDLRPPLEGAFLREHRADVVAYFTDGDGPAPDRSPRLPVLWVLVPGGKRPTSWGRAVKMAGIPWWERPGIIWGGRGRGGQSVG